MDGNVLRQRDRTSGPLRKAIMGVIVAAIERTHHHAMMRDTQNLTVEQILPAHREEAFEATTAQLHDLVDRRAPAKRIEHRVASDQ
jgi:hypothetical protein